MRIKGLIALSVFILLFLQLVSAVEFSMKENYSQGETMIAKVSGNFVVPPANNNVFFYEGHVRIPVDWGMVKVDSDYYIYALLEGKHEGNYSISIENVKYMKGSETISGNLARNFTITNATADFSIKPGAVASTGTFSLDVQNLQDKQITITAQTQEANNSDRDITIRTQEGTFVKTDSYSLYSGGNQRINFISGTGYPSLQTIKVSSGSFTYIVPVYISTASLPSQTAYNMEPTELISSIPTNVISKKTIFIYNTGNSEIKNITLTLSDSISPFVNLSQNYIDKIEPNTNLPVELSFFSSAETEVQGTLKANINSQAFLYSQISLKFLNDYVPANETETSSVKTCGELAGKVCSSGEKCDKEIVYAKDNVCCLGSCVSTTKKSSTGIWIAVGILVVIAFGLFLFYKKKYKKARKPVNLLEIARGKK